MKHGFTLIEIIVVIIIVGILAAVGMTQYSKTVENAREAEARKILGDIYKFAYDYWLTNGSLTGMTYADVNIGSAGNQIPGPNAANCTSTHYFYYRYWSCPAPNALCICATRCTTGGKSPPGSEVWYRVLFWDSATGITQWRETI